MADTKISALTTKATVAATDIFPMVDESGTPTTKSVTFAVLQAALGVRKVVTLTDAATVTPNADTTSMGILSSLSQTTTFANPTGTPTDGQRLEIRVKSASSQAVSFGTQYRSGVDILLPTTTTGSAKTDRFLFEYDLADTKWDIVGRVTGY